MLGSGVDDLGPKGSPDRVVLVTFALASRIMLNTRNKGCVMLTGFSPSKTLQNVLSGIGFTNPSERRLETRV